MKRRLTILISILIFVFILALPVCASELVEPTEPTGTYLEVVFPYMGTQFELYRVATANSSGGYSPTNDFKDCPVDFEKLGNATDKAAILESYVHLWGMEPTMTDTVGWGDFAYFEEVDEGMYLLISRHITVTGATYKAQPLLFLLPVRDSDSGVPVHRLTVSPKPYLHRLIPTKLFPER